MNFKMGKDSFASEKNEQPIKKRKWIKYVLIALGVFLLLGIGFAWKAGITLNKISSSSGSILSNLTHVIPGVKDELKGEKEGRINVLLLGMRGEELSGGGLLADTIMVASFEPQQNRMSLVSIPRDLYVTDPGTESKSKINAVYAYGEQKKRGGGIEDMKQVVGEISGLPIHYGVAINFKGFQDLVDAVGGIQVTLDQPFDESLQFNEARVCDSYVFTKPAINPTTKLQMYENKYYTRKDGTKYIAKQYPLCTNPNTECGGEFKLAAGTQTLSGQQALCYARSRKTSSDFERAKRQQMIIGLFKDKMTQAGTLADFTKINGIFDALGNNVRTDMAGWEIKRMYDVYKGMQNPQLAQRVLENSEEGLLYHPETTQETGYILLPIGDNYDRIRDMFKNIFSLPVQSDIKPK